MTAELSRHAINLGINEVKALVGEGSRLQVNDGALLSLAEGYAIRALGLAEGAEIPALSDEVVLQIREALLALAPLDLIV